MASTYTVNLGIEKIGTGEQSGTWGTTTNTNFDLIDQAINGAVTVTLASAGTSGVPNTLAITDGASSDGRNKFIEFADGADLGATAYVQLTPNDAEKIVHMRNSLSGGRSVIIFQGTYNASNDFEIPNGKDVVLKFDGGGATATVTQVFEDLLVTAVAATTVDTTNIEVTNLKAKDGTSAGSIADSTGVVTLASSVLTTTDINGGSVDGVTLGTNSAVTEAQIDNININGNTISSTDTNGNVTITPDGTGSVAITKIDVAGGEIDGTAIGANSASTAVFTDLTASGTVSFSGATVSDGGTVTTINIDGGSIDNTVIGAATPAAGSFTTGQFGTSLNVDGTITTDGLNFDVADGVTINALESLVINIDSNDDQVGRVFQVQNGAGIILMTNSESSGTIFNEGGADLDFRVESDNNTHALFVDGGTGNVLISTSSVAYGGTALNIGDTSDAQNGVQITTSTTGNGYILFGDGSGADAYRGQIHYLHSDDSLKFYTAGTARAGFTSSEIVFNDVSADTDFRVESNNNTHALFLNGGNGHFGIGESSPGSLLHVSGSGSDGWLYLNNTNATADHVMYFRRQNSDVAYLGLLNTDQYWLNGSAASKIVLQPKAATELVINESSQDADFRVESDNNTHMLFVDAGTDQVNIGDSASNWSAPNLVVSAPMLDLSSSTARTTNAGIVLRPSVAVDTNGWYGMLFSNSAIDGYGYTLGGRRTQTDGQNPAFDIRYHSNSTSGASRLYFASDQTVFNEESGNYDFRVESDSNNNMLFVDGGNNRVGVGTGNPAYTFVVSNGGAEGLEISAGGVSANRQNIISYNRSTSAYNSLWVDASEIILQPPGGGGGSVNIGDTDANVAKLNVKGEVSGNILRINSGTNYQGLNFQGLATYGNGTVAIEPVTIPGSGTANQYTWFKAASDGGTTTHNVIVANAFSVQNGAAVFNEDGNDNDFRVESDSNAHALFVDASTNVVYLGKSSATLASVGYYFAANTGGAEHTCDGSVDPLRINRLASDGALVTFWQDTVNEGSISVSGTTVSYNGGHLSRWSQLHGNNRDESLLKGTVLTNLDEMAEWIDPETGEPETNEQLNKMAVSSVEGDPNVAGVFVNWDDDDDMNVAMTGDMIIRIAQGTTVQRGDLLMSAGDGTAKPQGDDIVRSKTIAKVTSTNISTTYADGSYCVPCVLMAC